MKKNAVGWVIVTVNDRKLANELVLCVNGWWEHIQEVGPEQYWVYRTKRRAEDRKKRDKVDLKFKGYTKLRVLSTAELTAALVAEVIVS